MRVILVLFLAGFTLAAASSINDLDQVDDIGEFVDDFYFLSDEGQDDFIQKLKDRFREVVKKVKDAIDQGKSLKDGMETLEKIRQKLKEYNIDLGDFGGDYLEQLKDKVKDYWQKLKDRLGVSKRNIKTEESIDVVEMVHEFKKLINEEFDLEKVKAFVEKYVGENKELVESLTRLIQENGKESQDKTKDFLRKLIREMLGSHKRSASDDFQQIRDFFQKFEIPIREKYARFGKWLMEHPDELLEKNISKLMNVRNMAKVFLVYSDIPREVALEALEFFHGHKEDLGHLFRNVVLKVEKVLKQD